MYGPARRRLQRAAPLPDWAERAAEWVEVIDARERHLVPVDEPLVLITQLGRSGGTLLMRLFDGHPQCHAVPHELGTLFPGRRTLLGGVERAWAGLHDRNLIKRFEEGHRQVKKSLHRDRAVYPFELPPAVHRALFERCLAHIRRPTERDVVNCYMTGYFNAWLDNANLAGEKRWITGFEPNAILHGAAMLRVAEIYPDGRVISVLRDPWSWFASARRWSPRWHDLSTALAEWKEGVAAALRWRHVRGGEMRIVRFEDLVGDTAATMRGLATWLGLTFADGLLKPTFNGLSAKANSSFEVSERGVISEPLERGRAELSASERAYIDRTAGSFYEQALVAVG
jgi:hypothetical protein